MQRAIVVSIACAAVQIGGVAAALADDNPPEPRYFFSMRAPDVEPVPRYVEAWSTATGTQPTAAAGCDGRTYYLSPDDMATLGAALANQNSVELQTSPDGAPPQESTVVCLMQASP